MNQCTKLYGVIFKIPGENGILSLCLKMTFLPQKQPHVKNFTFLVHVVIRDDIHKQNWKLKLLQLNKNTFLKNRSKTSCSPGPGYVKNKTYKIYYPFVWWWASIHMFSLSTRTMQSNYIFVNWCFDTWTEMLLLYTGVLGVTNRGMYRSLSMCYPKISINMECTHYTDQFDKRHD